MKFCQFHHWNKFNNCEGYCQLEENHSGGHETCSLRPETRDVEGPLQIQKFLKEIARKEENEVIKDWENYERRRSETEFGNLL